SRTRVFSPSWPRARESVWYNPRAGCAPAPPRREPEPTMKSSALQDAIVAHLRASSRPESSRDLARRFLRIERADEETCRRLLAPFLLSVPGVAHRAGEGWSIAGRRRSSPVPPPRAADRSADRPGAGPDRAKAAASDPATASSGSLRDFVAIAS